MNITTITAEDDLSIDGRIATMTREWLLNIAADSIDIEKCVGFALARFASDDEFKAYAMKPYTTKTGVKEVLVLN